jgi:hypothetical protein
MLTRDRDLVATSSTRQWRYLELQNADALLGFMHAVLILKPGHRFLFLEDRARGAEIADLLDLSWRDIDSIDPDVLGPHPIYISTLRVRTDWVNQNVKYVVIDASRDEDYKRLVFRTFWRCLVIGVRTE